MTAAAPIARDFVVSTTYRKEEQAGSKWSRLRGENGASGKAAPAARPDEEDGPAAAAGATSVHECRFTAAVPCPSTARVGSISDIARGVLAAAGSPPESILATILEYIALPLRWEPLNGASPHRGVPSGGGAFGVELFLIARDGAGLGCFRHLPLDGALRREGGSSRAPLRDLVGEGDLAFVIVGDLARYLEPYGEFSPCLASLECGIVAAQLSLLCHAHGWASETLTRHDYRAVSEALQLGHWSRIPAVIVRVRGPGAGEAVTRCRTEILSTSDTIPNRAAADRYPRMRELIETIVEEKVPHLPAASATPGRMMSCVAGPPVDLLELIRRRSSGLGADLNRPSGAIAAGAAAALAADIAALHSLQGSTDLAGVDLSVSMLAADQLGRQAVPFQLDPRSGQLPDAVEPARGWSRFDFTIGVDDVAEERRSGSRSFILNHIAAGALAQRIGLAATAHGLFARPLRGYAEPAANRNLGLEYRAILQIACGARQQANPTYDLKWW